MTRNRRITPSITMYFAKSIFYFILMKRCFYIVKNIIFVIFGVNANYIFSIPKGFLLKFLGFDSSYVIDKTFRSKSILM